jgi:hypothetical protein
MEPKDISCFSIPSPDERYLRSFDVHGEKLRGQLQIKVKIILPMIWGFFNTQAHR